MMNRKRDIKDKVLIKTLKLYTIFIFRQGKKMESNPWQVDSIDIFYWLKCPECMFFSQEELDFKDHAMGNHPRSYTLFGNFEDNEDQGNLLRDIDNCVRNRHTHP